MSGNNLDPNADNSLAPVEEAGSADAAAAALRMDMLGGSDDGASVLAKPKISGQNGLLVLVVIGAVTSLAAMRYIGMGPRSSIGDVIKIDYDVAKPVGTNPGETLRVLADLSTSQVAVQVPPELVQRNPFKFAGSLNPEVDGIVQPDSSAAEKAARAEAERQRREAEERRRAIETTLAGLTLNSVMGGDAPLARISGNTVRVGDVLGGMFTVVSISGRGVVLECDGTQYELTIAEGGGRTGGTSLPPNRRNQGGRR